MKTSVTYYGNSSSTQLSRIVDAAMSITLAGKFKVTDELLRMPGMSGTMYRKFINNLVQLVEEPRYLEVGSWAGSTLCSAIQGNKVRAFAIDNWSQFQGPQSLFFHHLSKFVSAETAVSFLNSDFRKAQYESIGKHNIYLFDGPHEYKDQYDGLLLAKSALDGELVLIVDDWN